VEDGGWGWTASKIRQVRLVEWLTPQSSSVAYVPVKPFYDAQPDQQALTIQVVHDELRHLARRSLIDLAAGAGGIESYDARATTEGRRLAEELQARRSVVVGDESALDGLAGGAVVRAGHRDHDLERAALPGQGGPEGVHAHNGRRVHDSHGKRGHRQSRAPDQADATWSARRSPGATCE
jgi:hypothetical protein